jgi:hypothetical protein
MGLPSWNMRVAYNSLAFQNVKSGKQFEGAAALVVVGRRWASRVREPELFASFLHL